MRPERIDSKPGFVRAITLWNPHATLMVLGEKRYETRSRPTLVRGRVLIHSAITRDWEWMCQLPTFKESLGSVDLQYGYLLGSVDIVRCSKAEVVRGYVSQKEETFGNYDTGRYAWKTENFRRFDIPVRFSGRQRFFWVPEGVIPAAD